MNMKTLFVFVSQIVGLLSVHRRQTLRLDRMCRPLRASGLALQSRLPGRGRIACTVSRLNSKVRQYLSNYHGRGVTRFS